MPDIRLGTAVVPTYPRHPMALAQQALTVSQVSGGRLDLGIGLSHQPVVEGMWGLSFERPVRHMRDYLEVLTPLLRGESVSHTGEMVTGRGQLGVRAEAPPVYVAALGEQMLKVTGRLADGTVTWMTGPVTVAELTAPTIRAAAAEAGRPEPKVISAVPVGSPTTWRRPGPRPPRTWWSTAPCRRTGRCSTTRAWAVPRTWPSSVTAT